MTYESPEIVELGRVSELTLGNGGTSLDGNNSCTQRGRGNDGTGPHDGSCDD